MTRQTKTDKSFEEALSQLEHIINQLQSNTITLEKAVDQFEVGMKLLGTCDKHLSKARGKITQLIRSENGKLVEKILGSTIEQFPHEAENET